MQQNQCLYLPSSGPNGQLPSGTVTAEKPAITGFYPRSEENERERSSLNNTRTCSRECVWDSGEKSRSVLPLLSLFLMNGLLLTGCDSAPPAPTGPRPTVARICRDGSYIYRHADGTYWAWNGYRIDDIDKVCDR
jgi:hypothetical protein